MPGQGEHHVNGAREQRGGLKAIVPAKTEVGSALPRVGRWCHQHKKTQKKPGAGAPPFQGDASAGQGIGAIARLGTFCSVEPRARILALQVVSITLPSGQACAAGSRIGPPLCSHVPGHTSRLSWRVRNGLRLHSSLGLGGHGSIRAGPQPEDVRIACTLADQFRKRETPDLVFFA